MAVDEKTESLIDTGKWKLDVLERLDRLASIEQARYELEQARAERERKRPDIMRIIRNALAQFVGDYDSAKR